MFNFKKLLNYTMAVLKDKRGVAFVGVTGTKIDSGGVSTILGGLVDGRVKCMLDTYVILGSEIVDDTLLLGGIMPIGANVIAIGLNVDTAQTSAQVDIGDAESTTRYATNSNGIATADLIEWTSGDNYVTDDTTPSTTDRRILLTIGGATLTAGNLQFVLIYSFD